MTRLEHITQKCEAYEDIFLWLLGEKGDFPDLSQKPHYSFRTELRERINRMNRNEKPECLGDCNNMCKVHDGDKAFCDNPDCLCHKVTRI